MFSRSGDHILAMQVRVKNRSYEVYWNGSHIVVDPEQARIYSRPQALAESARLVNKGKLFYAKEIS